MSEEIIEETVASIKVKFVRDVKYKGIEFKAGATASVESDIAARLLSLEVAEIATSEEKGKKGK